MSESRDELKKEFQDKDYREAYAEDFLNTSIATQIVVLREQRGLTQGQLAQEIGTHQAGVSRIENVNYSVWNVRTLKKIAFALGVRLKISFETFSSLLDEAEAFSRKSLERPKFEEDPIFQETARKIAAEAAFPDRRNDQAFIMKALLLNDKPEMNKEQHLIGGSFIPGQNIQINKEQGVTSGVYIPTQNFQKQRQNWPLDKSYHKPNQSLPSLGI